MLRFVGCELPVQWWYRDSTQWRPWLEECAHSCGATVQDASEIRRKHGHPRLARFAHKPYSIAYCPFDEVMLLDADLVAVRDPSYLFDDPAYLEHGSLFWPDFLRPAQPELFSSCFLPYDASDSFQGGQQIIDKRRCVEAMKQTLRMNFDSEIWYELTFGEQDLYRVAWQMTETPYGLVRVPVGKLQHTILEFDPEGRRLFQHRCGAKWSLKFNPRVYDFWFEEECLALVDEYAQLRAGHLTSDRKTLAGVAN